MRLIDADALMEEIKSLQVKVTGLKAGKGILNEYAKQYRETLLRTIDEQPTAYDIDKGVDELEKASKDVSRGYLGKDNNKYHKHYKAVKLSRVIEIVKQGCVSDDEYHYLGLQRSIEIVKAGGNINGKNL